MTRVTKMKRKTHVEASHEWNVTAIVPKSRMASKLKSDALPAPDHSCQDQNENSDILLENTETKRKREEEQTDSAKSASVAITTEGNNDVAVADGEGQGKKKRMRHKSKNAIQTGEQNGDLDAVQNSAQQVDMDMNAERAALRRRERRLRQKERLMTCFVCRKKGHSVKNCPVGGDAVSFGKEGAIDKSLISGIELENICYKCGSNEHKSSQWHLAGACEQNEKGLYPMGGSCRYCGSVRHLAKDCKPSRNDGAGVTELGVIDNNQGGDDDDVFLALKKMQKDNQDERSTKNALSTRGCKGQQSKCAPQQHLKKKIVKF
ncbi:hypothetical protein HDU97_002079 [Phlyctochytrium planicorne]|nr:hypothetical protein HDU97_002079 [Phlyctochytrium planicorne]